MLSGIHIAWVEHAIRQVRSYLERLPGNCSSHSICLESLLRGNLLFMLPETKLRPHLHYTGLSTKVSFRRENCGGVHITMLLPLI